MAKIYLIRHAESIANTQGKYQGQTYDTPLSPLGEMQSQALRNRFVGTRFDQVFSSPLKRTTQTAMAISQNVTFASEIVETNHIKRGEILRYNDISHLEGLQSDLNIHAI